MSEFKQTLILILIFLNSWTSALPLWATSLRMRSACWPAVARFRRPPAARLSTTACWGLACHGCLSCSAKHEATCTFVCFAIVKRHWPGCIEPNRADKEHRTHAKLHPVIRVQVYRRGFKEWSTSPGHRLAG